MIQVRKLSITIDRDLKTIVEDLSFTVPDGEKVAAATPSGGIVTARLPVESFAFGTNEVCMTLKVGEKELGRTYVRLRGK